MKRSLIIRQLMNDKNMKVSDISKESGIAYSTVKSILEKGTEKANYINICKICSALGITSDELEKMVKNNSVKSSEFSKEDKIFLDKYHNLDEHGKEMVNVVLNKEYERWQGKRQTDYLMPVAAHNDDTNDPEQQRLMAEDMDEL